jgi:hypothetical protein
VFRNLTVGFAIAGGVIAGALAMYAWHVTTTPGAAQPSPFVFLIPWPTSIFLMGTEKMAYQWKIVTFALLIVLNVVTYASVGWLICVVRGYVMRR